MHSKTATLIQKLGCLQDLGGHLWLLPFFPLPLKDEGYDISYYTNVHSMYGTMDDFRTLLAAAHERDLQAMIELVVKNASDQRGVGSGIPPIERHPYRLTFASYSFP